ncbi:MAG TPA: serine/threonine-protein kinase [Bryobacteraceae bacterium]|nr:serine/threonine-protein kinase [Bryobacteraceae bacterium]
MPAVLPAKQFGRYQIIRKLGRSMTDVYLALDDTRERRVVLKIVEHAHDPLTQTILDAERRGAAIQRQLHAIDPRVLEVYECGEQDNCFFVAMEYCEGRSLADILQMDRRLDPHRAARYAMEVCSQLTTLHSFQTDIDGRERAVVHGDIKPANIQIDPQDRPRLLDFGIAKAITNTHNLTGHNLGSPAYCSPERLKNAQVDPSADLWALGVTLYELITGLPPYQAQTTRRLENIIQSRRPPRALPPDCPPRLKAIIAKALAADLPQRYATAAEFESDLRAFLENRRTSAEGAHAPSWDSNATIERPSLKIVGMRTGQRLRVAGMLRQLNHMVWALVAGLVAGLLILMPAGFMLRFWMNSAPLRAAQDYTQASLETISSDWQLYKELDQQNAFLHGLSPIDHVRQPLRARLVAAASDVIEAYRNSSEAALDKFDWEKARTCLRHALELRRTSDVAGKLALCDGYASGSRSDFEKAARLLPHAPDPHLALARLDIYSEHNVGQAMAEFEQAERLGYHLGPRENEELGDAYLWRAEQELREFIKQNKASARAGRRVLLAAQRDFGRAHEHYEPISGFSKVSDSLDRMDRDEAVAEQWEARQKRAEQEKSHAVHRRKLYSRR